MRPIVVLLAFVAAAASVVEDESCSASDEWCVGKRRQAETLLQANKMKLSEKRMAIEDIAHKVLPPRRMRTAALQTRKQVQPEVTSVKPFNCSAGSIPGQVLQRKIKKKPVAAFKGLDVATGHYTDLFQIPFDKTSPPIQQLNSCAVSPITDLLYCTVQTIETDTANKTGFVVRVDADTVEFVVLAYDGRLAYTGGFASKGTYFFGPGGKLNFVRNIDSVKGYSDPFDERVMRLNLEDTIPRNANFKGDAYHDIVVVEADYEQTGEIADYGITFGNKGRNNVGSVGIVKLSESDPDKSWLLTTSGFPGPGESTGDGAFGAGWNFRGRVFFARNNGEGVYELNMDSIDLAAGTAVVERVGFSDKTSKNDGFNCMQLEAPDPPWHPDTWTVAPTPAPTAGSQRTCVAVGIETMQGPGRKVDCDGELQCNVSGVAGHDVGAYDGDFEPIIEKHMSWPTTRTEVFGPWPEHTKGVVIGVMVGDTHATGKVLETTVITLDPEHAKIDPFPEFSITMEVTEEGQLIVTFPKGPFIGETMRFAKEDWMLGYPCPEEPTPTTAPTEAPTVVVTADPTVAPTVAPTVRPTLAPPVPTVAPTSSPTEATPAPTESPTEPVCFARSSKFNWEDFEVRPNNLGGTGPNFDKDEELRFEGLVMHNGEPVDLVVKTVGDYQRSGGINSNGQKFRKYGAIALSEGTEVDLEFSFEDEDGEPVVVDRVHLSFFDFDRSESTTEEVHIAPSDMSSYLVAKDSGVRVSLAEDGRVAFASTLMQDKKEQKPPKDPAALNSEEKVQTAMIVIEGKSSIPVTLKAPCEGDCDNDRIFFFGSDSSLSASCSA